jgi:tetratricopeptide (TPR) repeat protein
MLAARVDRELVDRGYARVPADSVRVVRLVPGPAWRAALDDTLAAPYEELASIETLGVGHDAAADALAALRRRVGEAGGNVALVRDVRKDPVPPYTRASGLALRTLPPMPDAVAHCASLAAAPDSAGFRVAVCREATRVAPDDPALVRDLAFAYLALYERGVVQRKPGLALQSARGNAQLAMQRAAALAPEFATPAPWVAGVVRLAAGDSLHAFRNLGWLLEGAGSIEGSLAAFQDVIRLAPDSADGYDNAVTMSLRLKRPDEALRVAAAFARRHPERVEGWARAGVAANVMGDHVRAMRFFGRVLQLDPKYFGVHWEQPYGLGEYRGSEQRAGKQPPATVEDLGKG